ncbi:peroxisomal membrane anchor protein conserved region-domain-containing protein [Nemania sp. NC0429]|nr:peroxisomal membrane anchor protein conserved region-domain-containing protein [Nemania sp. NC0429]
MDDSKKSDIPAWQQAASDADAAADANGAPNPKDMTLEHARRFLEDETVKAAPPSEKRVFLRSKGLDDSQITQLLDEPEEENHSATPQPAPESSASSTPEAVDHNKDAHPQTKDPASRSAETSSSSSTSSLLAAVAAEEDGKEAAASSTTGSQPPIITYPEFLTKPQRPPPLITPSRLANILTISGGVWALFYGISALVIRPMVDDLNEARSDYYHHVRGKVTQLVERLEGVVSEVPYKNGKPLRSHHHHQGRDVDDGASTTSDPTELFHRDVGTQTSPPPSTIGAAPTTNGSGSEKPVDAQARQLSAISAALRELTLMHTQRAEGTGDLRTSIGELRDTTDKLAYPPAQNFSSVYGALSFGQNGEPDDEFKKTRDAIRSVKGIFLSSRSFPAVTAR